MPKTIKYLSCCLATVFLSAYGSMADAQPADTSGNTGMNKKRLAIVTGSEAALYTVTMIGLNELWYKEYPRSSFHFFNDNDEWLQVDKAGHFFTSYQLGLAGSEAMKWSGLEEKKAVWYGGNLGLLFLTSVEIFDGFSAQWGASSGDAIANAGGAALFIGQHYLWKEQRITPKYSFHPTDYSSLRPKLMGENLPQQMLKDYNGQTYWLSFNLASFLGDDSSIPSWISLAFGYGGEGMVGGTGSVCENVDCGFVDTEGLEYTQPLRQYYFSFDVDLSKVKTKSRFVNGLLHALNCVKVPFPALEYNNDKGLVFQPFYF